MMLGQRTPVTILLLVVIAIGYAFQFFTGGLDGWVTQAGANYGPAVAEGQYWRPVTAMFLHGGIVHLLLNGYALYQLGSLFEIWLGSLRLLVTFFLTGIAGSIASIVFTQGISVGASGAIFGLLGALIAFLLRRREMLTPGAKSLLSQLVGWAVINVFFGFSVPGIDNAAHLGGCAAGLLLGLILRERPVYRLPPMPGNSGDPV
jgi:rhomboid protease GluP